MKLLIWVPLALMGLWLLYSAREANRAVKAAFAIPVVSGAARK